MQAIQSILTPIDFSDNAGKIVKAAAYVARNFQGGAAPGLCGAKL